MAKLRESGREAPATDHSRNSLRGMRGLFRSAREAPANERPRNGSRASRGWFRLVSAVRAGAPAAPGLLQRWYLAQPTQRIVIAVLELQHAPTDAAIEAALRALCERHAALGVCSARSPRRLALRPLGRAEALPCTYSRSDDVWTLASAELHRPFALGAPLFRVIVSADRRRVVGVFDHAIADGLSAGIFARELACLLAGRALPETNGDAQLPLDARLSLRPSLPAVLRALAPRKRAIVLAPPPPCAAGELRTQLNPFWLARERVEGLRKRARAKGVTLHAALSSAALLAALDTLELRLGRVRLTTPISLRGRCSPQPDGLGVFIGGVETELELARSREPWQVARQCMRDLTAKAPSAHGGVAMLALAGDLERLARRIERAAPRGRTATVELSNLGELRGLPPGAVVWMTQGCHYHAALFVLSAVTSDSDGALRVCLSTPAPLISAQRAAEFLARFERRLESLNPASN
jgi:hypothetical protein